MFIRKEVPPFHSTVRLYLVLLNKTVIVPLIRLYLVSLNKTVLVLLNKAVQLL